MKNEIRKEPENRVYPNHRVLYSHKVMCETKTFHHSDIRVMISDFRFGSDAYGQRDDYAILFDTVIYCNSCYRVMGIHTSTIHVKHVNHTTESAPGMTVSGELICQRLSELFANIQLAVDFVNPDVEYDISQSTLLPTETFKPIITSRSSIFAIGNMLKDKICELIESDQFISSLCEFEHTITPSIDPENLWFELRVNKLKRTDEELFNIQFPDIKP